ncbi:MAG: SDR family NAD(P)-dependent oxidoreductase [Sphingomonadales bacterium]|jgi:NAD(P)-dependent dehydrogenase (short-subunit alcohol dehydrogenase family)
MRRKDENVVVTGAARGLGLACVNRFVEESAGVVLADTDATEGETAVSTLPSDRAMLQACDASRRADMAERQTLMT